MDTVYIPLSLFFLNFQISVRIIDVLWYFKNRNDEDENK